jgi:ABC-type molybdate transport system substrate-binding protein
VTGVTIFCDPALRPALEALAPLAGMQVGILSAPPPAMLEQIRRRTRDDVLVTLSTAMDQAAAQNFIDPTTRIDGFSNPLVLATLAGCATKLTAKINPPSNAAGLRIAVTDATIISGLDGKALLAANGFPLGANTIIGAASTQDALFLLLGGEADAALIYRTDAKSNAGIASLSTLQAGPALTAISAAVNAKSTSPGAKSLLTLMRSQAGAAALAAAGLEIAA